VKKVVVVEACLVEEAGMQGVEHVMEERVALQVAPQVEALVVQMQDEEVGLKARLLLVQSSMKLGVVGLTVVGLTVVVDDQVQMVLRWGLRKDQRREEMKQRLKLEVVDHCLPEIALEEHFAQVARVLLGQGVLGLARLEMQRDLMELWGLLGDWLWWSLTHQMLLNTFAQA
jgi:hypothetical protein